MVTKPRTLSSDSTYVMKVIIPVAWGALCAVALVSAWIVHRPATNWNLAAVVVVIFSAANLLSLIDLKRVRYDDRFLYVSNYRKEIVVPLGDIEDVTENRWLKTYRVTVHFSVPTEFGRSINFAPPSRILGWSPHPVIEELRNAAGLWS